MFVAYAEKLQLTILTAATSADVTLMCNYSEYREENFTTTLTIINTHNPEEVHRIAISCNSTGVLDSLIPATNYTAKIVRSMCLSSFNLLTKKQEGEFLF